MTRRKVAKLSLVAVMTVVGVAVAFLAWKADRTSMPDGGGERRVSLEEEIVSMPGMRRLVDGTPHVTGCNDRGHDGYCRVEGPTGLRAECFLWKRTAEFSCFEVKGR
ncbi:MAG TPA: hypothetical protein VEX36_05735 [Thermoleophilaceae bacterium]|nr:hypothetical protein [Thermoleophilaceae bacterium]